MYLYKIGYGSYEDSCFTEFTHEEKFSEEELNSLVISAIIRALEGVASGENECFLMKDGVSYEDIQTFVDEELEKDGFVPTKYQARWSCFGWPSLVSKDAWIGQRGDVLDQIYDKIPVELREKIVKMGREWTKKSDEELEKWVESQKEE